MKRLLLIIFASLALNAYYASAQMADKDVINYVQDAVAQGQSQSNIRKYLRNRGVTSSQILRLKSEYEARSADPDETIQKDSILVRTISEIAEPVSEIAEGPSPAGDSRVFGHEIFSNKDLSFEPNLNVATPQNYKLGPGDEILIDIWGESEDRMSKVITAEGKIFVSQVGPISLNGLTISEASSKIRKALSSKYSALNDDASNISVSLGNIRTISVSILGEVAVPGTYRLSSFSTVFHAIYRAGGINESGTLRAIKLIREGKEFALIDIYNYLFSGKSENDVPLEEGDVIIVPPFISHVGIIGDIKRPKTYEMKPDETVEDLINFAGGFKSGAYSKSLNLDRYTEDQRSLHTISSQQYSSFKLIDGDVITIGSVDTKYLNRVEIKGAIMRPGVYQIGEDVATLKQLIIKADGLRENAFAARAIILREKDNLELELIPVKLGDIVSGVAEDVLLKKNDVINIMSIQELNPKGDLIINGFVAIPGAYPYTEKTTIEDLILQAGGLLEGASMARVDVARRIVDPMATESTDTLGITYSFKLKDGFVIDSEEPFYLEPNDVVSIRESPGYSAQTYVYASGELAFPGQYILLTKNDRVSDIVKRAGGLTNQAYKKGARLIRRSVQDSSLVRDIAKKDNLRDTVDVSALRIAESYLVAVDLEMALENPGSDYDIVLKSDDRLIIPEYDNTVRIVGEVMHPTAISFVSDKSVKYYADKAGGFSENAKRSNAYIIYANGQAAKAGSCSKKVEPGCMIVVPSKLSRDKISPAEITSIASATTSMTYVIALLTNLFLK